MPQNRPPQMRVPTMPNGTEVASYATYLEAQGAVDYLSDTGFDVKSITIVGTDLHMVERVTGRLTMGRVAASGAGSGALWGTFMGLMLSFASTSQSGALWILVGLAGGALFGVVMSAMFYAAAGGQRDFTSQSQVVASRYAVLASMNVDKAFDLLQKTPGNQVRPTPRRVRPEPTGPTEYGSRPDERPRFGVRLDDQKPGTDQPTAPVAPRATPTPEQTPTSQPSSAAQPTPPQEPTPAAQPVPPQEPTPAAGDDTPAGDNADAIMK